MKKIVLTFGLISGAVSALLMLGTMTFIDKIGFERGTIVGYTVIVLSFLFVFFGIRSYRENVGGGYISFGRAFAVGILIALISSFIYIVTWEIEYRNWLYDFPDKYTAYVIDKARASGASAEEIARQSQEWESTWALYRSSMLVRAAFTLMEPLPVGVIITLISALALRRRPKEQPVQPAQAA
jgi:uncharacterized protein DUF4199